MTTRQNVPYIEGKEQLPTGYDTQNNDPSTFSIPPCGIEDVDMAVHALFDTDIKFQPYQAMVGSQKEINVKKPFVIFATGERFAMAKRLKPFRDRNGFLLLPAISIRRTCIEQQHNDVFQGELTIKRRLDESDVDYQQLINRFAFKNIPNPPGSLRETKDINFKAPSIREGMLLDDRDPSLNGNHVYEVIAIPFPQFYTATYEVVFWTTYTQHMNYMIETLFASQIVPGKGFYLKTEKGYWFSALVDPSMKAQDNFEDITEGERIVKYSFELTVRGFLLAPQGLGQRVPFKRYLSAVNISFETIETPGTPLSQPAIDRYNETKKEPTNTNPFVLTDIEQDPITQEKPITDQKIVFSREYRDLTGQKRTKYVTQTSNNQKRGETVYTASDQQVLQQFFADKTKGY
jgi:hypothetical protein